MTGSSKDLGLKKSPLKSFQQGPLTSNSIVLLLKYESRDHVSISDWLRKGIAEKSTISQSFSKQFSVTSYNSFQDIEVAECKTSVAARKGFAEK